MTYSIPNNDKPAGVTSSGTSGSTARAWPPRNNSVRAALELTRPDVRGLARLRRAPGP